MADLKADEVDAELAAIIPIGFAKQHRLLPVKREGDGAVIATADPLDVGALDDLRMQLGAEVYPVLVPAGSASSRSSTTSTAASRKRRHLADEASEDDEGGEARSSSTSSTSPTRRPSSAG